MNEIVDVFFLPPIQGLLGGTLAILVKMLVDWFTKTHFAQKRQELRSYEALYDSVAECEARYSILWKSEFFDSFEGKPWPKPEYRQKNERLKTFVLDELFKMHKSFKWIDDKELQSILEKWEKNIQARIRATRKKIEEEPLSEEDQKAIKENPYGEILGDLKQRLRKLARYNY